MDFESSKLEINLLNTDYNTGKDQEILQFSLGYMTLLNNTLMNDH